MSFIDAYQDRFGGVEPICGVLAEHGWQIAPSGYWAAKARAASTRQTRDERLVKMIYEIRAEEFTEVYGARKMWRELNRRGQPVARCTVERLMRREGLSGAVRGKKIRTTVADPSHERAPELVRRNFTAPAPNRVWVADFTEVVTWAGVVYVAFVVDVYSRAVVGWHAATNKRSPLVVEAVRMALWRRDHTGHAVHKGLIHHSDAGSQYTSFRFTAHLLAEGIDASIGTVGDALDNALMESTIGLYKTELINRRGPWRTFTDVEVATAHWVDWYNGRRLHSAIGYLPPEEYEAAYYDNQP